MKKISFIFFIIAAVAFYFWPAEPNSGIQKVKASIADVFSSVSSLGKDYSQELAMKRVELQAHEELLKKADAGIEQMKKETESQICPETGRPGIFILNDDPRPNVREKIAMLRQEIAELEHKVNK